MIDGGKVTSQPFAKWARENADCANCCLSSPQVEVGSRPGISVMTLRYVLFQTSLVLYESPCSIVIIYTLAVDKYADPR
jgi:hypothetical protein